LVINKKIVKVTVNKGANKSYSLVNNNKYYIRVASTSREASQEELIRLLQESNQLHYKLTPILGSGIKDLNKRVYPGTEKKNGQGMK
jgi:ATP-dependent DNA helicase RecG